MKINISTLITGSLLSITACSSLVLTSAITHADNDSTVDDVTITVPVACTMTGTITTGQEHTATLQPGTYSGDSGSAYENGIGKTTLATFCNDYNGFSIYAIGFAGETEGDNTLVGTSASGGATIPTKVYESTDTTSNWSMKVTKVTDSSTTFNPANMTITNSFDSWHTVPDDYTKVAEYHASTGSSATDQSLGAKVETTYASYISTSQPADTYTGKVKYVMVHPYNATKPIIPTTIATAEYLQEVNSCPTELPEGQAYTLKDSRDEQEYKVAKLADGRCWMLDNLRLDPTDTTTATNMNGDNTNAPETAITNYLNGGNPDHIENWTNKAVIKTSTISGQSEVEPELDDTYKDLMVTSYGIASTNGQAKAGIYYSYCAATAGTYCSFDRIDVPDTLIDAPYDICPANWRMPTGGPGSEYETLAQNYSSTTDATNPNSLQYNLSTPLSGGFIMGSWNTQNNEGFWISSTVIEDVSSQYMYALNTEPTNYSINTAMYKNFGITMRCILK